MAFNLPAAQYLMRSNSSVNRGSFDNAFQTGLKTGGNLPITFSGAQVQNSGGNEGIYFGLSSQNSTAAFDASINTRLMITSVQFNAPNRIQVGSKAQRGVVIRTTSGAGGSNYREFVIGGNDTPFASAQDGPKTICIDISATGEDSSGGSYDNSDVTGWGFGSFKENLAGGSSMLSFFQRVFLFDTNRGLPNLPTFTGVSSFDDAVAVVQGSGYTTKIGNWCTKSGSAVFLPVPFSIGDGVSATVFDDAGAAIISPANNALNQENFRLTNNAMRVYLDTRDNASDTVVLSGSYSWGTAAPWDFDISNASACALSGSFSGMGRFTLGSSVTATGTFNLFTGQAVVCKGAQINGITVRGDLEIKSNDITTFQNLTVDGFLDLDTPGTYTFDNCVIDTVTNSSGGNIIILNSGSLININAGPNIDIQSPPKTLTLTGLKTDTEVRVYEVNTTNEVAGIENSGNTFTASIDVPSVDIVIHSIGYEYQKIKGVDTSNNATLPIQQRADRNYGNP